MVRHKVSRSCPPRYNWDQPGGPRRIEYVPLNLMVFINFGHFFNFTVIFGKMCFLRLSVDDSLLGGGAGWGEFQKALFRREVRLFGH